MKFKYLKLSLLTLAFSGALHVASLQAADVCGAIQEFLKLTDCRGPRQSMETTKEGLQTIINKLSDDPQYHALCNDLTQLRNSLTQIPQVQNALQGLQEKLARISNSLSEVELRTQLKARIKELKNMNMGKKLQLLTRLGVRK